MSEMRLDPLSLEWITVASKRLGRPVTTSAQGCPFCPVSEGAGEAERAASEAPRRDYAVAVFPNRFPSFGGEAAPGEGAPRTDGYASAPAGGRAEIVLYSPVHDTHLGHMDERHVALLVRVWADRTRRLAADPSVQYVFCFENRGHAVGQTIDHPHGQIYAYPFVPPRVERELAEVRRHRHDEGECLQCAVLAREAAPGTRGVDAAPGWTAFVPYAPRFPFELHLVPARHVGTLAELDGREVDGLAALLRRTVRRYDGLHDQPMPYMMCIFQAPTRAEADLWHLRVAFYPIHRAQGRMKYLAGSESGAGAFLQDATPEAMAAMLAGVRL
jgi:UDPglucose--hexose-1-phosphate uridylyltransferase